VLKTQPTDLQNIKTIKGGSQRHIHLKILLRITFTKTRIPFSEVLCNGIDFLHQNGFAKTRDYIPLKNGIKYIQYLFYILKKLL
jgi:hypothetical protein